jgi:hypothetical protein
MTTDTIEIVKTRDDWKFVAEVKNNAKGEPQVSVKARSDASAKEAGDEALTEYRRLCKELDVKE